MNNRLYFFISFLFLQPVFLGCARTTQNDVILGKSAIKSISLEHKHDIYKLEDLESLNLLTHLKKNESTSAYQISDYLVQCTLTYNTDSGESIKMSVHVFKSNDTLAIFYLDDQRQTLDADTIVFDFNNKHSDLDKAIYDIRRHYSK